MPFSGPTLFVAFGPEFWMEPSRTCLQHVWVFNDPMTTLLKRADTNSLSRLSMNNVVVEWKTECPR